MSLVAQIPYNLTNKKDELEGHFSQAVRLHLLTTLCFCAKCSFEAC